MTSSTTKSVIVERFDRESLAGYINPQSWLLEHDIELLRPSGDLVRVPYAETKVVYFVRDLNVRAAGTARRLFTTRPKTEGLWVRMLFRDGAVMDGVLSNNLLDLGPYGFTLLPPDPSANNQRIFVPRAALAELKILGVIGSRRRRRKPGPPPEDQIRLFD